MSYSIHIRPTAERDLADAYAWYERQKPGLGHDFIVRFEATLGHVSTHPLGYVVVHGHIRRAAMRRFPYGVFFQVIGDAVFIVGIFHARRHPRSWQSRGK